MMRVVTPLVRWLGGALAAGTLAAAAWAAPTDANEVIVPGGTTPARPEAPARPVTGTGTFTLIAVVLLAGAGAWLLWRGKATPLGNFGRGPKQLQVEETRSLGGRQYLVVASYQDKKFLLGVCPGRIDLLAPLSPGVTVPEHSERP